MGALFSRSTATTTHIQHKTALLVVDVSTPKAALVPYLSQQNKCSCDEMDKGRRQRKQEDRVAQSGRGELDERFMMAGNEDKQAVVNVKNRSGDMRAMQIQNDRHKVMVAQNAEMGAVLGVDSSGQRTSEVEFRGMKMVLK